MAKKSRKRGNIVCEENRKKNEKSTVNNWVNMVTKFSLYYLLRVFVGLWCKNLKSFWDLSSKKFNVHKRVANIIMFNTHKKEPTGYAYCA